jgi:hypothetical protein
MGLPPLEDVETFVFLAVAAIAAIATGRLAAMPAPPIRNLRRDMPTLVAFSSLMGFPPFVGFKFQVG